MYGQDIPPVLRAVIEREKAKIKVEPYYDTVMTDAFVARVKGVCGGLLLGLALGAGIGAVAVYVLPMLGVTIPSGAAASVFAKFVLAGSAGGAAAGGLVGASGGAAAAAAEERERRERGARMEREILRSPELQQALYEKYSVKDTEGVPLKNFGDVLRETEKKPGALLRTMVSFKTMLFTGSLGAALGAIYALSGGGGFDLVNMASSSLWDQTVFASTVMGMVGATLGLNLPVLFTSLGQITGNVLAGNIPGFKKKELEKTLQPSQEIDAPLPGAEAVQTAVATAYDRREPQSQITLKDFLHEEPQAGLDKSVNIRLH